VSRVKNHKQSADRLIAAVRHVGLNPVRARLARKAKD
jgi:hypothetical protein